MHLNLLDKFSESEQMASMEFHVQKGSGNFPAIETENTLSNVTSIQSQLQSLYDCNDSLKNCDKYNNYKNINLNNPTDKLVYMHENSNTHLSNKSLAEGGGGGGNAVGSSTNIKLALEPQQQTNQNPELETKTNNSMLSSELKRNPSPSPNLTTKHQLEYTKQRGGDVKKLTSVGIAIPTAGLNNTKTATILVSKTKTKTGLPLLLKNSIN